MAAIGNKVGLGHRAPVAPAQDTDLGVGCDWGAARHTGTACARSEDAWQAEPCAGLFAFAEGLGGYNAGDVASAIAVDRLLHGLVDEASVVGSTGLPGPYDLAARETAGVVRRRLLVEQINAANRAIHAAACRQPLSRGMATSVSCLWLGADGMLLGHVGHSEVWLLRGAEWLALNRPRRDGAVPSRLLGVETDIEVESSSRAWVSGDRLILCSAGTAARIGQARMAALVRLAEAAGDCAMAIVDAARSADSLDNVAALAVFVTDSRPCAEMPVLPQPGLRAARPPGQLLTRSPGRCPAEFLSAPDRAV